jgi:hypothetical protein
MATQSFYEMMEIDTPEKARRLAEAFRIADERGPIDTGNCNFFKELEEGEKWIDDHPW